MAVFICGQCGESPRLHAKDCPVPAAERLAALAPDLLAFVERVARHDPDIEGEQAERVLRGDIEAARALLSRATPAARGAQGGAS